MTNFGKNWTSNIWSHCRRENFASGLHARFQLQSATKNNSVNIPAFEENCGLKNVCGKIFFKKHELSVSKICSNSQSWFLISSKLGFYCHLHLPALRFLGRFFYKSIPTVFTIRWICHPFCHGLKYLGQWKNKLKLQRVRKIECMKHWVAFVKPKYSPVWNLQWATAFLPRWDFAYLYRRQSQQTNFRI